MVRVNMYAIEPRPEFVHTAHVTTQFFHADLFNDIADSVYDVADDLLSERASIPEMESSLSDDLNSQTALSELGCEFEEESDGCDSDGYDSDMSEVCAETRFEQKRSDMIEGLTLPNVFAPSRFDGEETLRIDNEQWSAQRYRETAIDLMASFGMELAPINDELVDREEDDVHMERLYVATEWDLVETFGKVHASTVVRRSCPVGFDPMEE